MPNKEVGMFVLVVCYCVWHPSIGDMLLLFLLQLLLLKYYPEGKDVECLQLKQKWKIFPNSFEQLLKKRTWLERQVLVYIIWIGNTKVLPESAEICSMCPWLNTPEK